MRFPLFQIQNLKLKNQNCRLASPAQRLAASATDALLVFAAHVMVLRLALAGGMDFFARVENTLLIFSPIASWLYFWLGWWRGATLGKKLWRVRVVREDGSPLSIFEAGRRVGGYMLASLPVKGGLLPILWDARRQGWHDKIARTVVLNANAQDANAPSKNFAAIPAVPDNRTPAQRLDFSAARRGWPLAAAAYFAFACAMSFPLVTQFSTRIAGKPGDSSVFLWNYWFFQRAIENGLPLTHTDLLFHPRGASLLFHTMNWFNCAVAFVLLRFCDLITTYNLLFLFSLSASAFSAYFLCAAWTKNRRASFVAALTFGFSPYFLAHGLGHMNLIAAQFLPLLVLWFYAALTARSIPYAVLAGVTWALCGYCDLQFAFFGGVWMACLLAGLHFFTRESEEAQQNRALLRKRLQLAALALALGVLLLAPLVVPAFLEQRGANYMNRYGQIAEFSATPADYLSFNPFNFLLPPPGEGVIYENIIGLGWVLTFLVAVAVWKRHQALRLWILSAAVFAVLSCGAALQPNAPGIAVIALGGAPGNGFDLPLDGRQVVSFSADFLARPQVLLEPSYAIKLPMAWLPQLLSPLKAFRVPARLALGVLLAASVLAACALTMLDKRLQTLFGRRVANFALALIALLLALEYFPYPYPISVPDAHSFYAKMGKDKTKYAIGEAPLAVEPTPMQRQTRHGKAILLGNLSRAPREGFEIVAHNKILLLMSQRPEEWQLRTGIAPPPQTWLQALSELRALNVRYLIVRKREASLQMQRDCDRVLQGKLKLPILLDDDRLRVYQISR
jgi:uncharacterized RDD family membrane protein YckC